MTPTRTADGEGYIRCAGSVREVSGRELVVLGTASQAPTRHRNHNGYLLRWDAEGFLFDPGEGTQRQMLLAGVARSAITRLCLTHFHGDHCLGVPGIVQRLSLDRVPHPVRAHYPASGQEYFDAPAVRRVVPRRRRPARGADRRGRACRDRARSARWRRAGSTTGSRRSATGSSSRTAGACCRTGWPRHGIAGRTSAGCSATGALVVGGRTVASRRSASPGRASGSRSSWTPGSATPSSRSPTAPTCS